MKCIIADLFTSNLELWLVLHLRPPPSFVMMFYSRLVIVVRSVLVAINAMSSTYPIASSSSGLLGISSRSALYSV